MGSRFLKANAAVAIAVLQDLRQTAAGQAARAVGLCGALCLLTTGAVSS